MRLFENGRRYFLVFGFFGFLVSEKSTSTKERTTPRSPGTDVMIFKIFSPKFFFKKKLAYFTHNKAKL
jgi:hypothetical protein